MRVHKGIPILNVYYMLAYAFEFVDKNDFRPADAEEFENQQDLLASLIEAAVGRQLKQGLYRQYVTVDENLPILRGKINIRGTLRNLFAEKRLIACEYDELSVDNIYNRIVKTTMLMLLSSNQIRQSVRDNLKRELLYFSDIERIEPSTIHWDTLRFERNNRSYRLLISLCQLVIEGLLMMDAAEESLAPEISNKQMHKLYELFILNYYKKHWNELNPAALQIPWAVDDGYTTMLPVMQTDITLRTKKQLLIIDAKYYGEILQARHKTKKIRSSHLYQIFAYVKNATRVHDSVSGMLLYARTQEATIPDEIYHLDGNQIAVRSLNLANDFKDISAELDSIATSLLNSEVKNWRAP